MLLTTATQMAMAMLLPSSSCSSSSAAASPSSPRAPAFSFLRPRVSISSLSMSDGVLKSFACSAAANSNGAEEFRSLVASPCFDPAARSSLKEHEDFSRREAAFAFGASVLALGFPGAALADLDEDYKKETQQVIEQVKKTLTLDKTDPSKPEAVALLRAASNDWVAKYRREKKVAGKPSFSNMYSVLNAISGHYISFGPSSPIPVKRQQRIFEEITDAEKALTRGR